MKYPTVQLAWLLGDLSFCIHRLPLARALREIISRVRTHDYPGWVEAYARNHYIPIEWAEKGVRKEDYLAPALRRREDRDALGVYLIFKSMELGRTFRISMPKFPTQDPNYRILAHQRSRFTHYYFYIRDAVLGPIILRVASCFPFHATYWLKRPLFHLARTDQSW